MGDKERFSVLLAKEILRAAPSDRRLRAEYFARQARQRAKSMSGPKFEAAVKRMASGIREKP